MPMPMDTSHLSPKTPRRPRASSQERGTVDPFHHDVYRPQVANTHAESRRAPHKLVLCFDGTGNKFKGDDSDSNILKIFRCLDRTAGNQFHYYQPGIGTYVVSKSLSHTSVRARFRSWYMKAKDSAVGSSFDQHVVGGYRFLMRFYNPGDEIYFFGFSRGAYVARFLAEMIDHVGLLSHGNEEMVTFAWKAFSSWQARRTDQTEEGEAKKREMYHYMKGFRETFSRPVKRIRFLGLFDTVNSVPRFETAWMQRSKFPYTARSSAKVIRHCVSIDERRAKFRQDLIYQGSKKHKKDSEHRHAREFIHGIHEIYRARRTTQPGQAARPSTPTSRGRGLTVEKPGENEIVYRPSRSHSRAATASPDNATDMSHPEYIYDSDEEDEQDIDEIWFSGGHADIGGGWEVLGDSKSASHVPLVYIIREAQKAGLTFDPEKLAEMGCTPLPNEPNSPINGQEAPADVGIRIDVSSPSPAGSPQLESGKDWGDLNGTEEKDHVTNGASDNQRHKPSSPFHDLMHNAHLAQVHDSLEYNSGLGFGQVLSWKIMEYMPFRRMDLQADGSWKPIRWPLPCGETRDIPHNVRIHGSVIRRMQLNENYRPGNLIIGGGGRGVRHAPKEAGIGEWECVAEKGDPVGEIWVKKSPPPPTSI